MNKTMSPTVLFNVGGHQYRVSRSLLSSFPNSMLARASSSDMWYKDEGSEIYIERNGQRFQYVLDYLRDSEVYLPMTECKQAFISELEYCNIDFDEDSIHSSQGQAASGLQVIQNTILKWRCADLAADCIEALCKDEDTKWRGDKKYLSLKPYRFKETYRKLNEKDIIKMTNEHLLSLGIKATSMEFDIINEKCRVTLQLLH